jgi:AraC family transcriptional regulator, regulatory protein of adaptative response / DNA-3-methyladenine glycosylase II
VERLAALPGIGPWTAQYVAMRAFREPDAFPASDLGLLRAMARRGARPTPIELARRAEAWRPWRAYAAQHLWNAGPSSSRPAKNGRRASR